MRRIYNGLVQFRYFIPQLIGQFLEFPHSFLIVIATFLAMVWSIFSMLHNHPLGVYFWECLFLIIIAYGAAIVLHFLMIDDSNRRVYQTFKVYPQALRFSLKWGMLYQVVALIVTLVGSFVLTVLWYIGGHEFISTFFALVSIFIWPTLGFGVLMWGLFAIDEADHAAANYANGVSMEDW